MVMVGLVAGSPLAHHGVDLDETVAENSGREQGSDALYHEKGKCWAAMSILLAEMVDYYANQTATYHEEEEDAIESQLTHGSCS
ncbi:UNVERIFIED_CONTAM: hypothetical protein K2H54_056908, partial [Gekko kuhli]